MLHIITRLKLTVELMSFISSTRKDYYKIVSNIITLLLFKPIKIKTEQMKNSYKSYQYKYIDLLQSSSGTLSYKREQQKFDSDVFTIDEDTIFPNYQISIADYNDCVSDTANTDAFKNIIQLYVNLETNNIERKITDVLFHSLKKCKSLTNFLSSKDNALIDLNSLDDKFKAGVIEIANYIIGEEINSNLGRIHPVYNAEKGNPSWKIDDLLSALYFSIFYLNPKLELYRQCANPKCQKWFLVSATTNKKKYCSQECCNRVTQNAYRRRKSEKNEDSKKTV